MLLSLLLRKHAKTIFQHYKQASGKLLLSYVRSDLFVRLHINFWLPSRRWCFYESVAPHVYMSVWSYDGNSCPGMLNICNIPAALSLRFSAYVYSVKCTCQQTRNFHFYPRTINQTFSTWTWLRWLIGSGGKIPYIIQYFYSSFTSMMYYRPALATTVDDVGNANIGW